LNKNILAGGHFYEGDLLNSVLTSELNYWQKNKANWTIICNLYIKNESKIEEYCYQNDYKNNWLKEFENFKKLN